MPQNGYGCQCQVDSLSRSEAESAWTAAGKTGPDKTPDIIWEEKVVGKNGSNPRTVKYPVIKTAKGDAPIDAGFSYNVGKSWLEPLTVPRLTGYDAVLAERPPRAFSAGAIVPPLPLPTVIKPSVLLPASTDAAVAVESFLNVFDASLEQGVVFEDAVGVPVAVTKQLFADEAGSFAGVEAAQIEAMNLLAMTLVEPDEIWHHWEADNNPDILPDVQKRWRLKRRYLRVFEMEGSQALGVSAFEWSHKGWVSSTAFVSEGAAENMDSLRVGSLVYAKEKQ
jgi:hypothetical protein